METARGRWKRNATRIKVLVILFSVICFLGMIGWAMGPLLNTIHVRPDGQGSMLDFRFRPAWYFVFLFSFNILPPILAFFVVMRTENTTRADLYFIFTVAVVVLNVIIFVAYFFYWFTFSDVVYSGKEPFNDYRWCCVYHIQHPELCPNAVACNPNVQPADLRVNAQFIAHWVFVGVYLIFAFIHLALNRLLRITGVVKQKNVSYASGVGLAVLILAINLGLLIYWAGVPLLNTVYVLGYPLIAIPPGPGDYQSTLYGFEWWMLWLLNLNIIPIVLFFFALVSLRTFFGPWLHYWTTIIIMILTLIVAVSFGIIWIFDCNFPWSGRSLCHDYRWCCDNFASDPLMCPNVGPCPVSPALSINNEFLQHFIFALIFLVFGGIHLWLNIRMKRYGIFYKDAE